MQSVATSHGKIGIRNADRNKLVEEPRSPVSTGGPILEFDLPTAVMQLKLESSWSGHRNARTLVKHRDCRIVLLDMEPGAHMVRHQTRGTVVIQVVSGHIKVHVFDEVFDVPVGRIISLDPHLSHDVEAVEESALLITIAWPDDTGPYIVERVCAHSSVQTLHSVCAMTNQAESNLMAERKSA
jgi:quercetin dioxygenase-like cupin family protein